MQLLHTLLPAALVLTAVLTVGALCYFLNRRRSPAAVQFWQFQDYPEDPVEGEVRVSFPVAATLLEPICDVPQVLRLINDAIDEDGKVNAASVLNQYLENRGIGGVPSFTDEVMGGQVQLLRHFSCLSFIRTALLHPFDIDEVAAYRFTDFPWTAYCIMEGEGDDSVLHTNTATLYTRAERVRRLLEVGRLFEGHSNLLSVAHVTHSAFPRDKDQYPYLKDAYDRVRKIKPSYKKLNVTTVFCGSHFAPLAADIAARRAAREGRGLPYDEGIFMFYLHQIACAVEYIEASQIHVCLSALSTDTILLDGPAGTIALGPRELPAPRPWLVRLKLALLLGGTPSNLWHVAPQEIAKHNFTPRLNTEGRRGGIAAVVADMTCTDPSAVPYRKEVCNMLRNIASHDWGPSEIAKFTCEYLFRYPDTLIKEHRLLSLAGAQASGTGPEAETGVAAALGVGIV